MTDVRYNLPSVEESAGKTWAGSSLRRINPRFGTVTGLPEHPDSQRGFFDSTSKWQNQASVFLGSDFIRARQALHAASNATVISSATRVLDVFESLASSILLQGHGIYTLPKMYATNGEDGSFLIEWIAENYRIVFCVEPLPQESSWHLVTKKEIGDIHALGSMPAFDHRTELSKLAFILITFMLVNME